MQPKVILNAAEIDLMIQRLAFQIVEEHEHPESLVLIGIQPRGVILSQQIQARLNSLYGFSVAYGILDITFYRDDIRNEKLVPKITKLDMSLENKQVVLVDDVLYTGRTVRAALDALLDFGRPARVSLCVLIDRKFHREIPIQPDYWGRAIDTIFSQKVKVIWGDNQAENLVELY